MTEGIGNTGGVSGTSPYNTAQKSDADSRLEELYKDLPEWFSTDGLLEMIQRMYAQKKFGALNLDDENTLNYILSELAEEKARQLGIYSDETYEEVQALAQSAFMDFFREQFETFQLTHLHDRVGELPRAQLTAELEEALASWRPDLGGGNTQGFSDRVDQLAKLFEEQPRMLIEWALLQYLAENPDADLRTLNPSVDIAFLSEIFRVKAAENSLKTVAPKPVRDLRKSETDLSGLSDILDDFSSKGIEESSRAYVLLLWNVLQGELEEAVAEENQMAAQIQKEIQESEYAKYVAEREKEMKKSGAAKLWDGIKRWGGTIAACLGAAAAWVTAAFAIASGVGTIGGIALVGAATALTVVALNMTVTSIAKECGEDLDLFAEMGKGIAKLFGADDELAEKIGMWTSVGITIALGFAATVCSLGAGIAVGVSSLAAVVSNLTNLVSAGCSITNGVIMGVSAGVNLDLALTRADLLEVQALLEEIGDVRNITEELMAAILQKIFQNMRKAVADSMETTLDTIHNIIEMSASKA